MIFYSSFQQLTQCLPCSLLTEWISGLHWAYDTRKLNRDYYSDSTFGWVNLGPRGSFTYFYHAFPSPVCPCLVLLHDTVSLLKHRNSSTHSEDFLLCLLPFHMDHIDAGLLLMHIRVIAFNALELRKVFKRWSGPDIANWQLSDQIWPINLLIFLVVLKKKKKSSEFK